MQSFLKQDEDGRPISDICRKADMSNATLKRFVADLSLGKTMLQSVLANKLLRLFDARDGSVALCLRD